MRSDILPEFRFATVNSETSAFRDKQDDRIGWLLAVCDIAIPIQ